MILACSATNKLFSIGAFYLNVMEIAVTTVRLYIT